MTTPFIASGVAPWKRYELRVRGMRATRTHEGCTGSPAPRLVTYMDWAYEVYCAEQAAADLEAAS